MEERKGWWIRRGSSRSLWVLAGATTVMVAGVAVAMLSAAGGASAQDRERVIGGPCEGCEAVFVGRPEEIPTSARIAPTGEPGEPMVIEGTVFDRDGEPAAGIVIYGYQTDAEGIYPPAPELRGTEAYRHGRLRSWVRSDERGRYRFETVRPASYPGQRIPAHVHLHVIEPGCCTYWIDAIEFTDDPLLPERERTPDPDARGGEGVATPQRVDGVWRVERDVHLGKGLPSSG